MRVVGVLIVLLAVFTWRSAAAARIEKSFVVQPSEVQISPPGIGGKRASYRTLFDFALYDGDSIDVLVTLASPLQVLDLRTGVDDLERMFFGTLNSFGRAATVTIQLDFLDVTGALLLNPLTSSQLFTGDLTPSQFSVTALRYRASVSEPLNPESPVLSGFGFGFDITADDVRMDGARMCGDAVVNTVDEVCDLGDANGADTACCDAQCQIVAQGRDCRPVANACDVSEVCDGASAACPADRVVADGVPCQDGIECTGADSCLGGVCRAHVNLPRGAACDVDGAPGGCDGLGTCQVRECGNDIIEPGEGCDGGECCTAECTLRTNTEPCGVETRSCHEQSLCNGREASCPAVDRFAPEGSTCADGNQCTVEDACRQGQCEPGPLACGAESFVRGNGARRVQVKVRCASDQPGECRAAVVTTADRGLARLETIMEGETRPLRRVRGKGPLRYRGVVALRLNAFGRSLLAQRDADARVETAIRRGDVELRAPVTSIRLLQILRRPPSRRSGGQ